MGCNCKNKSNAMAKPTPVVKQADGSITIVNEVAPPYTWEEVITVKDYLSSRNKTEEGRIKVAEFNLKYFGEVIPGYIDQACAERISKRIDRATELLNQWDATQK